jgi:hypothetical protein
MTFNFRKQALSVDRTAKKITFSENPKLPKAKKYSQTDKAAENYAIALSRINKLDLQGKVLTSKDIAALTRIASDILRCHASLVRPLMQNFLDVLMDTGTLDLIAWQIAGNRKTVLDRPAELFNNRVSEVSWMAGVIVNVVSCSLSEDLYAKIKLLDGPGAGFIVYAKLPSNGLRSFSYVTGALKKGSDKKIRGMTNPRQCVLFRVLVYMNGQTPAYSFEQSTNYKRIMRSTSSQMVGWVRSTPAQKKHNMKLFHERLTPCVYGYPETCHDCELGYDACSRACRPKRRVSAKPDPIQITLKGKNLCPKNLEEV